eukprot:11067033-Alexandrium_andersonii.AAC.2
MAPGALHVTAPLRRCAELTDGLPKVPSACQATAGSAAKTTYAARCSTVGGGSEDALATLPTGNSEHA